MPGLLEEESQLLSDFWLPSISQAELDFLRCVYGLLLLGTLLASISQGKRFFLSERWGGYGESCALVDVLHNPVLYPACMTLWLVCSICLVMGWFSPWAALVNLLICRYYCLRIRWKTLLRGLGAPGFMISWLAMAVFLLEFCSHLVPKLIPLALLVLQIDFALIFFASGLYKLNSGYLRGEGLEYALVNRQWCYWWNSYRKLSPNNWIFWVYDQLAWGGQALASILLLIPDTRFFGAALLSLCFGFVATHLRLLLLPQMVMLSCLLYIEPSDFVYSHLDKMLTLAPSATSIPMQLPEWCQEAISVALWTYLVLLPLVYGGLFYNFYLRKTMPRRIQQLLEWYANFAGIILWRVFSADLTHFFIMIYRVSGATGDRNLVSRWGLSNGFRFSHVGEALTVTSLFTILKYQPNNLALFRARMLRYTKTLPGSENDKIIFEFNNIEKVENKFVYKLVAEFEVHRGVVTEHSVEPNFSARSFMPQSPAFEVARAGSYLPVRR